LVGDSHADQWITARSIQAKAAHWKIIEFAKAACSIANLQLFNADLKREYRECDQWRASANAQIRQLSPALIIASQSDNVPGTSMPDSAWAQATTTALKALSTSATRVVYLQDSDDTPQDALACLQTHVSDAQKCTYQRDKVFTYPERGPTLQRAIAKTDFEYLPTTDFFCTAAWCPPVVQNMVVHRDPGHITDTYARWLSPMFAPIFK
jgi:hypothetical protein